MSTLTPHRPPAPAAPASGSFWTGDKGRRPPAPPRPPRPRAVTVLMALAGLGMGLTVGLAVTAESASSLAAPGGALTALGRLTGLVGTYAMLVVVLLVARMPALERVVGQDRLVAWHRRLGPWPLVLIAAHGIFITLGYAAAAKTGSLRELWTLLVSFPGVLAATAGFGLLTAAGVTSYRIARRKMAYETWWTVHLYTYLALALSFSHQVATGAAFVGHPFTRAWWTAAWLATAGVALFFRVLVPVARTLRHQIRVVAVVREAPGVISLVCKGRRLDRLPLHGGQFLQWRFLKRGLWWQAHPYSVSALPRPPYLRVTVKDLGDHSAALARITPGTRIAIEGPYGAFTRHARRRDAVLLAGAGVGVTPLRALLEDLPAHVDVTVLGRASSPEDAVLHDELAELVERRGGRFHELLGPRTAVPLDADTLKCLVPDVSRRDVYLCGPDGFTAALRGAARALGVPEERIHHEAFAF